ncbi:hypothetical protein D3C72_1658370 [compost metagenome]
MIQPCFAEFALNVVLVGKAKTTVGLHAYVGCFPRGFCRKVFRHVRFSTTGLVRIEQLTSFPTHQIGCFQFHVRVSDRELNTLVLADRATEYFTLIRVFASPVNKPITIP